MAKKKFEKLALMQQFGIWLGLPEMSRVPRTQKELAEKLGLSEVTLANWKKLPEVQEIAKNSLQLMAMGHNLTIWHKMIDQARGGNVQAQRLYFDLTGQLKDKGGKVPPGKFVVEYLTDRKEDKD